MRKPKQSKAPVPAPAPAAAAPPRNRRRLRVLIGIMVALGVVTSGVWVYESWGPTLPEIPTVDLKGADPEVAEAVDRAREAVVKSPRSLEAWARLAMILHAHSFADPAITCYTAVIALDPLNPLWPYFQGLLLQSGPNPESALPSLRKAVEVAPPDLPVFRVRLAELLLDLGRIDEAEKEFRQVLADDARNSRAQFGLAQVLIHRQQYLDALGYLQEVADNPSAQKRAAALSAAAYTQLGEHERAGEERRRSAQFPEDAPWLDVDGQLLVLRVGVQGRTQRALVLSQHGQVAEAAALMKETVKRYPQSDSAWSTLGEVLDNAKDFAGAEQAFQKSIQLAPDRAHHRFLFAEFLRLQRRPKEAAEGFRKTIEMRPADAEAYFKLGECLQELGDPTGAAEAYRQALLHRPDLEEARQRLAKLKSKS